MLLDAGSSLPEIKKVVTQQKINLYAEASKDYNPIHIDKDFATRTPAGGTIAHGMLILAYVSEMMGVAFGKEWLSSGKLNVRFKNPARPGDTITVGGKVRKVEKYTRSTSVTCEVLCNNQKGEIIIAGEAYVEVKSDETGI